MKKFNGRNVFGQRCIAKFVKLEKETAVEQYLTILADIENANGKKIEYTVDGSCFTKEEANKFYDQIARMIALRAFLKNTGFATVDFPAPI